MPALPVPGPIVPRERGKNINVVLSEGARNFLKDWAVGVHSSYLPQTGDERLWANQLVRGKKRKNPSDKAIVTYVENINRNRKSKQS